MAKILFIIVATLTLCLASCRDVVDPTLSDAERLMTEHPDSALALLQTIIEPEELTGDSNRALYALLFTQAQHKNYITIDNDSLISKAVDYFDSSDDAYHRMLALYYQGEIYRAAKDYVKALPVMLKAYRQASESDNYFWIGMTARGISDIYEQSYCSTEEVAFAEISLENFKLAKAQPHIDHAILQLAEACYNNESFDKAVAKAEEVRDSAMKKADERIYAEAIRLIGESYIGSKQYSKALSPLMELCKSDLAVSDDSLFLGYAYLQLGDIEHAKALIHGNSNLSSGIGNWINYEIAIALGASDVAMRALQRLEYEEDSLLRRLLTQNIAGSQMNYYDFERKLNEAQLGNAQITLLGSSIVVFVVISFLVLLIIYYRKRRNDEIDRNLVIADLLRETTKKNNQWQSSVKTILSDRFAVLDRLCAIFYENSDSAVAKRRVSDEVNLLMKEISSDDNKMAELAEYVNTHYDGILTKLNHDFPEFKGIDYKLIIYSILGFSTPVIAMFLTESKVSLIYARRKRIKTKIKSSDSQYKDFFIEAMS